MAFFFHLTTHSHSLKAIFYTQLLFNFGFFGLKSLFVLYMLTNLYFNTETALDLFASMMSLSYATSLLGGWIADKFLGPRWTLALGGLITVLGLIFFILSLHLTTYIGMALISLGCGFFKPNFSNMISIVLNHEESEKKDEIFTNLYIMMNVGGFLGPLICGLIYHYTGWLASISLIIVSFVGGVSLFLYSTSSVKKSLDRSQIFYLFFFLSLGLLILTLLFKNIVYFSWFISLSIMITFIYFLSFYKNSSIEEKSNLHKAIGYILLFTLFCMLYEQAGSSMLLFFEKNVDRNCFGIIIPSSGFLALGPLFILLMGKNTTPLLEKILNNKKSLGTLQKFSIGFFFTSCSFAIFSISAFIAESSSSKVNLMWGVGAILLQVIGEIFIIPAGFSKITKLSPKKHVGFMMGFWLLSIAYGHYLAGVLARYYLHPRGEGIENYNTFFTNLSFFSFFISIILILYLYKHHVKRWIILER